MRNKNFIIIVIGQIISLLGNAIQRFSMSLYLLEITNSTAAFARILAISTIPYIIFAPIAGVLSDNVNRKKIMVYLDFISFILIGIYALILFQGKDSELIIGIVMFLLSATYTLYGPAVTASIPQVVEASQLSRANAIISQVGGVVNFLGPVLAGMIFGVFGIKVIVVINAISFLISGVMELFLDIPDINIDTTKERSKLGKFLKSTVIDMKETLVYLKNNNRTVLHIIMSYALCNIFLVPILSIVAPFFINIHLGLPSTIYGIVEGVSVLGMIIGGIVITLKSELFKIEKLHFSYIPMILGVVILTIIAFIEGNNYILAAIFAMAGLAIMLSLSLSNILTLTYIQTAIPKEMHGRTAALSTAVATISIAPGQILFGWIIDLGIDLGVILFIITIANIGLFIFIKWIIKDIVK